MNRLTVALFTTADANSALVLQPYLDSANALLKPFDMAVEVFSTGGANGAPRALPYTGVVLDMPGDPGSVRQMAHAAVPNGRGIPVIFCKRQTDDTRGSGFEFGSTILTSSPVNNGVGWLPYILINTQLKSSTNEVLVHEMIHASYGESQPGHDTDPSSVFFKYGSESAAGAVARKLPPIHAGALRRSYFSVFA